jgi:PTH1 family peptidyl-tRNA hydrolase
VKLIVGLGNPGNDYEYTRHNLGFLVIRRLAEKLSLKLSLSSFTNGLTAEGKYLGNDICLLMPLTYMNNSGKAVKRVVTTKEIDLSNVMIICDDFNLDFGQLRLRKKGSGGGHNGLKSVCELMQDTEFPRLRAGVGSPPCRDQIVDYVLDDFTKEEKDSLNSFIDEAVGCCLLWLEGDVAKAMDKYNQKR